MNDTAVIIPCLLLPDKEHELTRFTAACVHSFRTHEPDVDIIIIDNGSTVDVSYLVEAADIYLRNETNRGYGPAVNQGLGIAIETGYEWLLVSNNDITLLPNTIAQMKASWRGRTGAVSSHLHDHDPEHKVGRQVVSPGMMFGALWLTRPSVLKVVGLLDEGYELGYWEDADQWQRMSAAGYGLIKAGHCHHIGNATSGKLADLNEFFLKNKARYEAKWGLV